MTRHELAKRGIVSRMRVNVRQRIGSEAVLIDRPPWIRHGCDRGLTARGLLVCRLHGLLVSVVPVGACARADAVCRGNKQPSEC